MKNGCLGFPCDAAKVWDDHKIVMVTGILDKGMLFQIPAPLAVDDIQPDSSDLAAFQRRQQRLFVDDSAPAGASPG